MSWGWQGSELEKPTLCSFAHSEYWTWSLCFAAYAIALCWRPQRRWQVQQQMLIQPRHWWKCGCSFWPRQTSIPNVFLCVSIVLLLFCCILFNMIYFICVFVYCFVVSSLLFLLLLMRLLNDIICVFIIIIIIIIIICFSYYYCYYFIIIVLIITFAFFVLSSFACK